MIKYIDILFVRLYRFYENWSEPDPFYTTSFVLSTISTSVINLFISVLYYITGYHFLTFKLFPVGILLIVIVVTGIYYFYKKKSYYLKLIISDFPKQHSKHNYVATIILIIMFLSWFIAPIFYKLGYA